MKHRWFATLTVILFLLFCGCQSTIETAEELPSTGESVTVKHGDTKDSYIYFVHTDNACQSIWERMAGIFTRRTGIPVTVEYVDAEEFDVRLQQVMAGQKMPTAFFLPDLRAAYVWDDYTAEISDTDLGGKVRYPSEFFYYNGKAAGVPESASSDRNYIALNKTADQDSFDATQRFFTWIFCSAEGRIAFGDRGLADCYE